MEGCRDGGMQRCRNAEMQECRDIGMQRHRELEMQRRMQRCRNKGMHRCRNSEMQGLEMQGCRDAEMLSKCEQHCERFLGSYLLTQWPTRASAFFSLHSHNTPLEHLPFKGGLVVVS